MAKGGEFGSIPNSLFQLLLGQINGNALQQQDKIDCLVEMVKAEHAAANSEKTPYVVELTMQCMALEAEGQKIAEGKPNPQAIQGLFKNLAALWT